MNEVKRRRNPKMTAISVRLNTVGRFFSFHKPSISEKRIIALVSFWFHSHKSMVSHFSLFTAKLGPSTSKPSTKREVFCLLGNSHNIPLVFRNKTGMKKRKKSTEKWICHKKMKREKQIINLNNNKTIYIKINKIFKIIKK